MAVSRTDDFVQDALRIVKNRFRASATLRSLFKGACIPAAVFMEIIGHDSEKMSEHYTHAGQEATRKAAEALPDLVSQRR